MPDSSENVNLQENFEDFFETSLCGFIIADPKGFILRANTKIATWIGCSKDDLKGKKFSDLLSIGGKIYYETHLGPLLRMQGFFDEVVLEISNKTGHKLRVLVNALERRGPDDKPAFVRFTILKGSDRLQYEQNLQQEKKLAEAELITQKEMVLLREQLIAVLGHDLRNPLSAIIMAVDILLSISEKNSFPLLTSIKRSSERMAEIVVNIMDFARTRLGQGIILNKKEFDLEEVLHQLVAEMKLAFPKTNILTNIHITHSVFGDSDRLGQLVSNLLANAVTHGDPTFPIHLVATDTEGQVKISVHNNGRPIPPEMHEHLFAPFTREANRPSQNGLGLGLYICSEIAQAHGGNLRFTSDEKETSFTFQIDYNKSS